MSPAASRPVKKAGSRQESKGNKTETSFLWTWMRRWLGPGLTSRREASMGYFVTLQAYTEEWLNDSSTEKRRAFCVWHVREGGLGEPTPHPARSQGAMHEACCTTILSPPEIDGAKHAARGTSQRWRSCRNSLSTTKSAFSWSISHRTTFATRSSWQWNHRCLTQVDLADGLVAWLPRAVSTLATNTA